MRTALIAVVLTGLCALVSACGAVGFPGVYRIDVEQGNIVTTEMVDQLRPGMSQRQVRFILGTPLVEDPFNRNRWDYLYSKRNGLKVLDENNLTVVFENDTLVEVRGSYVPAAFGGSGLPASDDSA